MALLNEAMLDDADARWPETSALIDETVGIEGSILTFGDAGVPANATLFFARINCRGVDRSAWQREYFRDYYAADEHIPRLRTLPDSRIVPTAALFSQRELKTSRTYNEMHTRANCQNGLSVRLDGPCGSHITWGTCDPVDAAGWSSSRVDMISRVLPHLRQYVRVRSALADAGALGTSATELLGNAQAGVVQLDRGGRIVGANDRALDLLRRHDGLSDRHGALRAASREDDRAPQHLLSRALPRFLGPGANIKGGRRPSHFPLSSDRTPRACLSGAS